MKPSTDVLEKYFRKEYTKQYHFKKIFPLAFFNILIEQLLVQIQTIHQQKACDLSNLEPEEQGRGMVKRVPRPLAVKDIEKKSKFNGAKSGRFFFDLISNILML